MPALDLLVLAFASAVTLMVFVSKTNFEAQKVKVRVKRK